MKVATTITSPQTPPLPWNISHPRQRTSLSFPPNLFLLPRRSQSRSISKTHAPPHIRRIRMSGRSSGRPGASTHHTIGSVRRGPSVRPSPLAESSTFVTWETRPGGIDRDGARGREDSSSCPRRCRGRRTRLHTWDQRWRRTHGASGEGCGSPRHEWHGICDGLRRHGCCGKGDVVGGSWRKGTLSGKETVSESWAAIERAWARPTGSSGSGGTGSSRRTRRPCVFELVSGRVPDSEQRGAV